ncbi:MAG: c-type cytochrome, partial [Phycisphaerae bacterium]
QSGSFKFSSTRAGRLPTDEDLRRTITRGLKASAMPAWDLLPARTVDALIAYIKTFSPKWRARQPAPAIPLVDDPYRRLTDKQAAIERGEAVYHGYATCWTCHPAYVDPDALNAHLRRFGGTPRERFRERLHESLGKPNTEGEVIFPPDFTRDFVRSGAPVEYLYRSMGAGITGTAMPTWIDSMSFTDDAGTLLAQPSDVWAVAYYVRDLIGRRPAKLSEGAFAVRDRRQTIYPPGAAPPAAALPPSATEEGFIQMDEEFVEDEDD